jgi:hypothetical protein
MDEMDVGLMGDLTETEKLLLESQEIISIQGKVCVIKILCTSEIGKTELNNQPIFVL